jgi:hypothetical protein
VSASSNRIDSSSGYDSTALTSPSSYQSPTKVKDNPVKREVSDWSLIILAETC